MKATEKELSKLFNCKADYEGLENEKPYSFAKFHTISDDFEITLRILIPVGEFGLEVIQNGRLIAFFKSSTRSVVRAERFEDKHILIIENDNTAQTHIRIKPDFFIGHEIKG